MVKNGIVMCLLFLHSLMTLEGGKWSAQKLLFKPCRMLQRNHLSHLLNVPHIPDVNAVIVVNDGDFEVLLVVGDGGGVRVPGIRRV
jgi:hypothetical protein